MKEFIETVSFREIVEGEDQPDEKNVETFDSEYENEVAPAQPDNIDNEKNAKKRKIIPKMEQSFECRFCDLIFGRNTKLRHHLRRQHRYGS